MHKLGVNVILGQRLDLNTTLPENAEYNEKGERVVRTVSGQIICAELIVSVIFSLSAKLSHTVILSCFVRGRILTLS